jgi:N6-L-threonylcarbamoyladenine synthase
MAAREQIKCIIPVIYDALENADLLENGVARLGDPRNSSAVRETNEASLGGKERQDPRFLPNVDAIAVTYGPGLIGSLLVGVETAKTLSYIWNKPLIPVNHLFGHIYANWIDASSLPVNPTNDAISNQTFQPPSFPAIALVVSGGHTDLVLMKSHTDITWLGGTRDDAAGECFDKCARLLGYPYPGGPKISQLAEKGNPKNFSFPRPMIGSHDYNFSFSGLKTAFLNATKQHFSILRTSSEKIGWQQIPFEDSLDATHKQTLYDLCASLQEAIVDVLVKKTILAAQEFDVSSILLSGGVAANELLKQRFQHEINSKHEIQNTKLYVPQKSLCTDNAAMIGAAALFKNQTTDWTNLTANPQLYFD